MNLLETTGIEFRDDEALALWRDIGSGGGVSIDHHRVRIDRELLCDLVSEAPSTYTMVGRDLDRRVTLGDTNSIFAPA